MKIYVFRYNDYDYTDIIGVFTTLEQAQNYSKGPHIDTHWIPNDDNTVWHAQSGREYEAVEVTIEMHELIGV